MGFLKRYNRDMRTRQHRRIYQGRHWPWIYALLRFLNAKYIARQVFAKPRLHYTDVYKERNGTINVQHTYFHIKSKAQLLLEEFTTTNDPS